MRMLINKLARKLLPPAIRRLIKRVLFSGWFGFGCRRLLRIISGRPSTIFVYPEDPRANGYQYTINEISHFLGYRISSALSGGKRLILRWEDQTHGRLDARLAELGRTGEVINLRCTDISKKRVDAVHKEVFGYSASVDPLVYEGECVEKSNENGKADGVLVQCPLEEARKGCVYQIRVNCQVDDEFVDEMRTPVFGRTIPFILVKYKRLSAPFSYSVKGSIAEVDACMSPEEVEKVLRFCELIGLDFGELDILRDRTDNRIYIVDANNTPTIHFAGYPKKQKRMILQRMARAFDTVFS